MEKGGYGTGIVILAVIGIALFGGIKSPNTYNANSAGFNPNQNQNTTSSQTQITSYPSQNSSQITSSNSGTDSRYKGMVSIAYVNRGYNVDQEYATIQVSNVNEPVLVTGWKLKSESSGNSVTIPKATYLFFANTPNVEDNIYLNSGETLYLITGHSPNGASFKSNKCSGYLGQFQTFVPYLYSSCPAPRDENLSSIPKTVINDDCLDYINSFPSCRVQTTSLPQNWSYECTNFIYNKLNYPSCVDTHKNDKDFYGKDWRVYLKRTDRIWKDRRETISLYDNQGKLVSTLTY